MPHVGERAPLPGDGDPDAQTIAAHLERLGSIEPGWQPAPAGIAAVSWGEGRIDRFWIGPDGDLRHAAVVDGAWLETESLGGTPASAPAVTAWAVDQMEVFAVFPDGQLWNRYWDGVSWHAWESLGGELDPAGGAAASSWSADRLDVWAVGRDGRTWHRWWDGARWVDWEQLEA
jgi:hypothetical protein